MSIAAILALTSTTMLTSPEPAPKSLYDFTMATIAGKSLKLDKYKGKVVLIVNVASKCGLTPQYKGLEELYKENKAKGLVVLGFPANNFGGQEPGSNEEISEFCARNYGVSFPMFSKISVKGSDRAELYNWLVSSSDRPNDEIEWNFAKFLVGKDGKLIKRFGPQEKPESPALKAAITKALG
jgi:glutathione peroxidase